MDFMDSRGPGSEGLRHPVASESCPLKKIVLDSGRAAS